MVRDPGVPTHPPVVHRRRDLLDQDAHLASVVPGEIPWSMRKSVPTLHLSWRARGSGEPHLRGEEADASEGPIRDSGPAHPAVRGNQSRRSGSASD